MIKTVTDLIRALQDLPSDLNPDELLIAAVPKEEYTMKVNAQGEITQINVSTELLIADANLSCIVKTIDVKDVFVRD